jgi:putative sterol carrier protein
VLRQWQVRVEGDRAVAASGTAPSPEVTIRMAVPTFARILSQELEPGRAFLEGKLHVEGDLFVASRLVRCSARSGSLSTAGHR